ncbi:MAG: hypothetical protein E7576_06940 [Ruminococcaceae bacterium]|nr:hypothetical protein [Oscillospiraceae bacterium]
MNLKNIGKGIGDFGKKIAFSARKHSPELLTGGAIALGIGTVIATWFAARKTDKALEEPKKIIKTAKEMPVSESYTEADRKHDIWLGYKKGAVQIIKLYGPVTLMGASSIACILGSHRILSNRNAGLIAANSILSKEFSDYRDKVIEKYGREEDYNLRFADKMETAEATLKEENGEEKTVTVEKAKEGYQLDTFSRCFDDTNPCWKRDTQYNATFLKQIMSQMTDKLRAERVLCLNEVYDALGFDKTQAGFEYGWICKPGQEMEAYVDFGIYDMNKESVREFIYGHNNSIWLDFNCSKIIWAETPFRKV